jgi:acetyl esterase/lipase
MSGLWLLLRFALALPWLLLKVTTRKLFGYLPRQWPWSFALVVEALRFFVAASMAPLLAGTKLNMPSPKLPKRLQSQTEQRTGQLAGRDIEWQWPRGTQPKRCILYLHGGAFVTGSIGTHRALMAHLAHAAQARVMGLDYRLAPEHQFPAGLEDCIAAWQELLASGERPEQLAIAGDSAGGGLTAATLLALKERGLPLPAAAWLLSPAVDLTDQRPSWQNNAPFDYLSPMLGHLDEFVPAYLGQADPLQPLASPIRGDLAGLPPLLIHVGEREVLHDQVVAYAEQARLAGVDVTLVVGANMVHVYPAFVGLVPQAAQAVAEAGAFLQAHLPG